MTNEAAGNSTPAILRALLPGVAAEELMDLCTREDSLIQRTRA